MIQVLYALQKALYDVERGIEYPPLKCMNKEDYSKLCQDPNAKACIFTISATQSLNSDIAYSFRKGLVENRIQFLVNTNIAKEEILVNNQDYNNTNDIFEQLSFEKPFIETQSMIGECSELQSEKMPSGAIKIIEHGHKTKDRYTSCSYGNYFIDQLELDLLSYDRSKSSLEYFAKQRGYGTLNKTSVTAYKKIFR